LIDEIYRRSFSITDNINYRFADELAISVSDFNKSSAENSPCPLQRRKELSPRSCTAKLRLLRKWKSITACNYWIPAFAGMTVKGYVGLFMTPSNIVGKMAGGTNNRSGVPVIR